VDGGLLAETMPGVQLLFEMVSIAICDVIATDNRLHRDS